MGNSQSEDDPEVEEPTWKIPPTPWVNAFQGWGLGEEDEVKQMKDEEEEEEQERG